MDKERLTDLLTGTDEDAPVESGWCANAALHDKGVVQVKTGYKEG